MACAAASQVCFAEVQVPQADVVFPDHADLGILHCTRQHVCGLYLLGCTCGPVAPHMHHQAPATRLLCLIASVHTVNVLTGCVLTASSTVIITAMAVMLQWHVLVSAAAMELVAMELKQSGSFIARTLSYEVSPVNRQLSVDSLHSSQASCGCSIQNDSLCRQLCISLYCGSLQLQLGSLVLDNSFMVSQQT